METKYIASLSGGKDSVCLVERIIEEGLPLDDVIFYDSGMEFEAVYKNIEKIKTKLEFLGIKFTRLTAETPFWVKMLIHEVNPGTDKTHYGYSWCGGVCRWGTTDKVKACNKYYKEQYPDMQIKEYIGIAFDEHERAKADANKLYPLIVWEMTENMCLNYCYSRGYDWKENGIELYDILDRVSCWCCGNKNLKELRNMYLYLPKYWALLKGLQSKIAIPFYKRTRTIFDLEKQFEAEKQGA